MIPKIIHSAWFGGGEKSALFKRCMAGWRAMLPDWEFREINEENLGEAGESPYIQSVLARREFVKATELARLVALERDGGIYLDCDVEVLQPLTPLLDNHFFIGRQPDLGLGPHPHKENINGAVIGSVPGGRVIQYLLSRFPTFGPGELPVNHYGPRFLSACTQVLPAYLGSQWREDFTVYPPEYFYPYGFTQDLTDAVITPNTFAIHHWAKSWWK